jgi:SAM-dependent methyltransferase
MKELIHTTTEIQSILADLLRRNGPEPYEDQHLLDLVDLVPSDDVPLFRELMQPILHPGTIIGFSYTKPFGYNGDFFIIEKIYQKYVNPDERCRRWDEFFHTFPAAIAVVNRKKLAIEQFCQLNQNAAGQRKEVLILGSGPANEVHEYLSMTPENHLHFDMIDLDQRAIDYAKSKNRAHLHLMNFMNKNVIRFSPEKKYDMIWSAGLFDYFKDKHFVYLIKKFNEYLKPGGSMIIGNFNTENPSRKIMEILGDWFLYHRSEEELLGFAKQADIKGHLAEVMAEPLGINLFLKIDR